MLDPKVFFIKKRVGRLAKKLVDRPSGASDDLQEKRKALEVLEKTFEVKLTESQVSCALLIYYGCFAQLATGEGKTYAIALSSAWLALESKHVHVVTPNEYLSRRDCDQLEPFFKALKLTISWIGASIPETDRFALYEHDIVYTTPSVLAFDRMRHISRPDFSHNFQYIPDRSHLIIDEADAVLIENGSVPFIFARNIESDIDFWHRSVEWVQGLSGENFDYDIQTESTYLSNVGYKSLERFMIENGFIDRPGNLYSAKNSGFFHKATMAVRAVKDFSENTDYLVSDNEVVILNQSTGRAEKDRQWGQGLHQAIEAKHGLKISTESEVVSKITIPEVLSLYGGFSGTSATILHAQQEIFKRYGRLTLEVDRAHEDNRTFHPDLCFDSKELKQNVIAKDAVEVLSSGRPVLIGTETIDEAIALNELLSDMGVLPNLLTAKSEHREAKIIAEAGAPGSLTIATNMAGRGTDIKLGGSDQTMRSAVVDAGGLHVIGSSRQLERRLDDQLSGRCGRQGDPGSVRFYVSLGDRLFKDQEKITSIRKITKRSLALLQKSKANKISVSRDEIDAYNDVFLIHKDIFYSLRNYWAKKDCDAFFKELLDLFSLCLRSELLEYGIHSSGVYKDFEGFLDKMTSLTGRSMTSIEGLNDVHVGPELCSHIEKKILSDICYNVSIDTIEGIRRKTLQLLDDMWCDHQMLLEQIYDHAKWQALIQKNERIQFAIFGYEAMSGFIDRLEENILKLLFESTK